MSWNRPFDPSLGFIVRARDALIAGRRYKLNETFDVSTVDARLLRRLYDTRVICHPDQPISHVKIDPLDHDANGRRGGSKKRAAREVAAPSEVDAADAMAATPGNTHAKLLAAAEGIPGVHKGMSKKAIALELIRAGRGLS